MKIWFKLLFGTIIGQYSREKDHIDDCTKIDPDGFFIFPEFEYPCSQREKNKREKGVSAYPYDYFRELFKKFQGASAVYREEYSKNNTDDGAE